MNEEATPARGRRREENNRTKRLRVLMINPEETEKQEREKTGKRRSNGERLKNTTKTYEGD